MKHSDENQIVFMIETTIKIVEFDGLTIQIFNFNSRH